MKMYEVTFKDSYLARGGWVTEEKRWNCNEEQLPGVKHALKTMGFKAEFKRIKELKGMIDCSSKIQGTMDTLKEAQDHLQEQDGIGKAIAEQPNFLDQIRQIQQYIDDIQH